MQTGFEFSKEAAKPKREANPDDAPTQQPMRAGVKLNRNPSTDQKKVRHMQARQQKTAANFITSTCRKCGRTGEDNDAFSICPSCGSGADDIDTEYAHKDQYDRWGKDERKQGSLSSEDIRQIQGSDPNGGDHQPTDADFAAFDAWIDKTFGPGSAAEYHGWGSSEDTLYNPAAEDPEYRGEYEASRQNQVEREGAAMNTNAREAQLLAAMAKASLGEQRELAIELEELRSQRRAEHQASMDIDMADTTIRDHLTPVFTHSLNTTATDWIDSVAYPEIDVEAATQSAVAEATIWFNRTSAEVKADRDEFGEQAMGMARRVASSGGEAAPALRRAFLDRVAFLHKQAESAVVVEPFPDSAPGPQQPDVDGWDTQLTTGEGSVDDDVNSDRAAFSSRRHSTLRSVANDSPGQVDEDQSGNAESQITDYDTNADQDPFLFEDWPEDEDDPGYHPPMPGAGEQTSASRRVTADGRYSPVPGEPFRWLEDPKWTPEQRQFQEAFPDGVPLHGDLTPEQQAWMDKGKKRSSRVAADERRDNSDKGSGDWECYGCGAHVESLDKGFDTKCPHCGSYELHLSDAAKRKSSLTAATDHTSPEFREEMYGKGYQDDPDYKKGYEHGRSGKPYAGAGGGSEEKYGRGWGHGDTDKKKADGTYHAGALTAAEMCSSHSGVHEYDYEGKKRYDKCSSCGAKWVCGADGCHVGGLPSHDKGDGGSKEGAAKDDGSIYCPRCKGNGMVNMGGAIRNCTKCKGSGLKPRPRKQVEDATGDRYMARRVQADDSGNGQNGQAGSELDQVEVGDPNDRPMWPWEMGEVGDDTGDDAADVGSVPTPGQSVDDYPQPKGASLHTADLVGDVMAWEGGEMDEEQEATFFQGLIDSGMAWQLQGVYGRTAQALIDAGVCHSAGTEAGLDNFGDNKAKPFGKDDDDDDEDDKKESSKNAFLNTVHANLMGGSPFSRRLVAGGGEHTATPQNGRSDLSVTVCSSCGEPIKHDAGGWTHAGEVPKPPSVSRFSNKTAAGDFIVPDNVGARDFDPNVLAQQVGRMNILSISGGRVFTISKAGKPCGISLPVSNGYVVNVFLANDDTYTVQRVFRGVVKGEVEGVYAEEVGEAAYNAGMFRSNEFGGHGGSMASKHECVYSDESHHSDDILQVFHGRNTPTYVCGYHEQRWGVPGTGKYERETGKKAGSKTAAEVFPCAICMKPATYYAFEEGYRASGVFLCDEHKEMGGDQYPNVEPIATGDTVYEDTVYGPDSKALGLKQAGVDGYEGMSDEAVELELFAMNDAATYHSSYEPVVKNLQKFFQNGNWDRDLAIQGMMHVADVAAQNYQKENGTPGDKWHQLFTVPMRREMAESLVDQLVGEMELGNFISHKTAGAYEDGQQAFKDGKPRVVPQDVLLSGGPNLGDDRSDAIAWYKGWDQANLAAPVED